MPSLEPLNAAEPWGLLAHALNRLKDYPQAEAAAWHALAFNPYDPGVWISLGIARQMQGDEAYATTAYTKALEIDADHPDAHTNLADVLTRLGRYDDAVWHGRRAVELAPESVPANWGLGNAAAKLGLWTEFWPSYEWRWRTRAGQAKIIPEARSLPYWGGEDLTGRRILLWCEQGDGDAIMFARYVAAVARRGPRNVLLKCPDSLARLFDGLPCTRVRDGDVEADCHCPLMSLPLKAGMPYPYDAKDYLGVPLCARDGGGRMRIGLRWSGSTTHPNDAHRSLPADAFDRLRELDAEFVNLQHGVDGGLTGDYLDTAHVIAGLDLVISVDTSVAHLAGAMGVPVWVILPEKDVDWRWGIEGEYTPWYASMRLLRKDGVATATELLRGMLSPETTWNRSHTPPQSRPRASCGSPT